MSQGHVWWGATPLVVGATGLLLLAFGAQSYEWSKDINDRAQAQAEIYEKALRGARTHQDRDVIVAEALEFLKSEGKAPDLQALAVDKGNEADPDMGALLHDLIYNALRDHRDPNAVLVGRIAFYAGLILVFAAGVLLYRRTPDSVRNAW